MHELLNLINNLKQHVFVIDNNAQQVIFINEALKNSYTKAGFKSDSLRPPFPCKLFMCGQHEQCATCFIKRLKVGEVTSKIRFNPVLRQDRLYTVFCIEYERHNYYLVISDRVNDLQILDVKSTQEDYAKRIFQNYLVDSSSQDSEGVEGPSRQLDLFLSYLASLFDAKRTAVIKVNEDFTLTYLSQWRSDGQPILKGLQDPKAYEFIFGVKDRFEQGENFIYFNEVSYFKNAFPIIYSLINLKDLNNLAIAPIYLQDGFYGFITLTNFDPTKLNILEGTLGLITNFVVMLTTNARLHVRLDYLSYRDQLTGLYNRHAMMRDIKRSVVNQDVAVVYCDITGLKPVNDTQGHEAGDRLIIKTAETLKNFFYDDKIYRIGGDEFLTFPSKLDESGLKNIVIALKEAFITQQCNVAVGSAFKANYTGNLGDLVSEADKSMYVDKKLYYTGSLFANNKRAQSISEDALKIIEHFYVESLENSEFANYIKNNFYSAATLFKALSHNSLPVYICFGDLNRNFFYVSDKFKNDFSFESNLVQDLFSFLENKLYSEYDRRLMHRVLVNLIEKRLEEADLHLRLKDHEGHIVWLKWHATFMWEESRDKPVFFAGTFVRQDELKIDPLTGLPGSESAHMELIRITELKEEFSIIAFALGNFRSFNDLHGHEFSNQLLQGVIKNLSESLQDSTVLYRLEGLSFIALCLKLNEDQKLLLARQILKCIKNTYKDNGLSTERCASIVILNYPENGDTVEELLNKTHFFLSYAQKNAQELLVLNDKSIAAQKRQLEIVKAIKEGLNHNFKGFSVKLRPIVKAYNEKLCAAECLLYYDFNNISYNQDIFVPIISRSNIYVDVVQFYVKQVIKILRHAQSYQLDFSLYTSSKLFESAPEIFVETLTRYIKQVPIESRRLLIQIPCRFFEHQSVQLHLLEKLRQNNLSLVLDNFGERGVNLSSLIEYQADEVKFNANLALQAIDNTTRINLLKSLLYACRVFDKKVHITAVNNREIIDKCNFDGEDLLEGDLFNGPYTLEQILEILANLESDHKKEHEA